MLAAFRMAGEREIASSLVLLAMTGVTVRLAMTRWGEIASSVLLAMTGERDR